MIIYIYIYIYIYMPCYVYYVMFKKRAAVLLSDIKHEAEAECFGSDKARTASFSNGLKIETFYMLIPYVTLVISVFWGEKYWGKFEGNSG